MTFVLPATPLIDAPVRIAVVGLGYWGPNIVRALTESPRSEPVWACDRRPEMLAKVASRFPRVRLTTSYDEVLDDPTIDAVALATPVSTHFELAADALRAGKHVFVEKPLAASAKEARDLIDIAREQRLTLMPGHTFLYSPPVNLGRDLIRGGELGDVLFITSSRVNLGLHQPDLSVIWDLGPHDFSILCYWLDEAPCRASALSRSCIIDGIPDVAFINLEFPSGAIAHVELSWLAPSKLRRTAVIGARKMLVYDDTSAEPIRIFDSSADLRDPATFGEYRLTYRTGDIISPPVEADEPLLLELEDFCAAVRDGCEPRSSAELGFEIVRTIEAVERSLELGGAPVDIESSALQTVA